jgi:GT2 family glycosyltransferase
LDLQEHCRFIRLSVIVTINESETLPFSEKDFPFQLFIIHNAKPKGFGANHNAAFQVVQGDFFCVLNPDLRIPQDPFPSLCDSLAHDPLVGVISPLILDPAKNPCDNARLFPTPGRILKRLLPFTKKVIYPLPSDELSVDWLAGIFLLFPSQVFAMVKGFDERYFLYYEDVDLCVRLKLAGFRLVLSPAVFVVHQARRASHYHPRYLRWHLHSMLRFFLSPVYQKMRNQLLVGCPLILN